MYKHFQVSIIIGILALSSGQALSAKGENGQGSSDKKKLAIALPKEQNKEETSVSRAVLVTPSTPITVPMPSGNPAAKYANAGVDAATSSAVSDLAVSVGSGSRQIGTNISGPADLVSAIQDVAQRGFQRAERITGAYDKRLSQMIAWLANSFMPSTTITPINSPSLCSKQRHFKIADGVSREEKRRAYLFN